jgi:hypothetical protein
LQGNGEQGNGISFRRIWGAGVMRNIRIEDEDEDEFEFEFEFEFE